MKNKLLAVVGIGAVIIAAFLFFRTKSTLPDEPPTLTTQTGPVTIKGSDTEVQLVSNLAEAFSAEHSEAALAVTGGGSGVGIAALINGEADIANSSRPMNEEERMQATQAGRAPQEFIVARDGISMIVHPDNPLTSLTLAQVGQLYSGQVTNWREVGGPDAPVVLYGRQSTSGTYVFFRDAAVKTDYAATMRSMEGNQAIVDAVRADLNGVGYVGVGYIKGAQEQSQTQVKVIDIDGVSSLDKEAVLAGRYALSRPIYQYLAVVPEVNSTIAKFIQFEASPAGQAIVEKTGFYPVATEDAAKNAALLSTIGITP